MASRPQLSAQYASAVALGDFNPAIIHPAWFAKFELISEEDASNAKIEVVTPDISRVVITSIRIQVTQDRFILETDDPVQFVIVRDLATGIFALLSHTPVRAFGFNNHQYFDIETDKDWHAIGDFYAPKTAWRRHLQAPGLFNLTIQDIQTPPAPQVQISLGPVAHPAQRRVYVRTNEHYVVPDDLNGAEYIGTLLGERWARFQSESATIARGLIQEPINR